MLLDFRIDWGYQYLYSRRHYHPTFVWDGNLTCEGGNILHTYQLDYPVIWFGPGHCAKETELASPAWKSTTKRGLSGVRFEAEVGENAVFHLKTTSFEGTFTAKDILEKGHIEFPVGPKYLGCTVIVTKTGYLWFRQPLKDGETEFAAEELHLPLHDRARMRLAYLDSGCKVSFDVDVPAPKKDDEYLQLHIVAMAAPKDSGNDETTVKGYIPLELLCDGKPIGTFNRYYRYHDNFMQMLEDNWLPARIPQGHHTLTLRNLSQELCLAIHRITTRNIGFNHGELRVPAWMLKSEKLTGSVYAAKDDTIAVTVGKQEMAVSCHIGWNEFAIEAENANELTVSTAFDSKTIEVYAVEEENPPVKVGWDSTVVPNDDTGVMDMLLDYTQGTRLGNYIMFRDCAGFDEVPQDVLTRWGEYCKVHGLYVAACSHYQDGTLSHAAGDMFHDCGRHEFPGVVYAADPTAPYASEDMEQATLKYQQYLREDIEKTHEHNAVQAYGDASGGIRHSFLAGADFVRAETMVGHTQVLLSQARPAAEALGKGHWGVHIAIQHNFQPYHENHLGQYFLSLMQPWMMGAEVLYEEDSLFELFKEERQAWDDLCTKGKRDMTRAFFKFVKTHPRKGKNVRRIAFLEGRYAAPFNGFICDVEQDPHYAVWGKFGKNAPEWGHNQVEKCRALLDVLMPGASTQPFRQKFDKRRFFFSGTPYGDFDCIPCEADAAYWNRYALLLNLGWNTIIPEDYEKMRSFVEQGGTLLTGLPQFSTHKKREFLKDMDDLALLNGGDLTELCGVKVLGKGNAYCGQWNSADRMSHPEPVLSAMPSDSTEEDGEALLAEVELTPDTEVIAWDSFSAKPLLVRHPYGKGYVYTFTIWAYPGHEKFQNFTATWVRDLADASKGDTYVLDETGEIFWTVWQEEHATTVMLLNTDWTTKGNAIPVDVVHGETSISLAVTERAATLVRFTADGYTVSEYTL